MKKKISILLILLSMVLIVSGCQKKEEEQEKSDAIKIKEEYEALNGTTREKDGKTIRSITIDEDNPLVYSTAEEIVEKLNNKESFIVYFGFTDCPWCRSVLPNLITAAKERNVKTIYYVNVKNVRDVLSLDSNNKVVTTTEGTDAYMTLIEKLANVLEDYTLTTSKGKKISTGEKRIFAPNVIKVIDGVAAKCEEGISDSQTDGYQELTDEMNQESVNKFLELIDAEAICDDEC